MSATILVVGTVWGALGVARVVESAGGAVLIRVEAEGADRTINTGPCMLAKTLTLGVETGDVFSMGTAVRDVVALPPAVRVRTVVPTVEVASSTVVLRLRREVHGALIAAFAKPLVRAVTKTVWNQAVDGVGIVVAIRHVALSCTVGVSAVVFDAAVTPERGRGSGRVDRGIHEGRTNRAVASKAGVLPLSVARTRAAAVVVARDRGCLTGAVSFNCTESMAGRERGVVIPISTLIASSTFVEARVADLARVAFPLS